MFQKFEIILEVPQFVEYNFVASDMSSPRIRKFNKNKNIIIEFLKMTCHYKLCMHKINSDFIFAFMLFRHYISGYDCAQYRCNLNEIDQCNTCLDVTSRTEHNQCAGCNTGIQSFEILFFSLL